MGPPTSRAEDEEGEEPTLCMAFDPAEESRPAVAAVVLALRGAGLAVRLHAPSDESLLALVTAPDGRLEREAERAGTKVELDADAVAALGRSKGMPLFTRLPPAVLRKAPPMHGPYRRRARALFVPLARAARLRLMHAVVEGSPLAGGAGVSPEACCALDSHPMREYFPLHDPQARARLRGAGWDLAGARAYFGEKTAFYFAFLAHYSSWLRAPAVAGTLVFAHQLYAGRVAVWSAPVFALLLSLVLTAQLEGWKRAEARHRAAWGMDGFAAAERTRPEFRGELARSAVTGHMQRHFSLARRAARALVSHTVILTLLGVVVAAVVGMFLFRAMLVRWHGTAGPVLLGLVNAVQIFVLNRLYTTLAARLTSFENHRTDTAYENAIITKLFLFKFINSYNSLFYTAFVKRHDAAAGGCDSGDCLGELRVQLASVFAVAMVQNVGEALGPRVAAWRAGRYVDPRVAPARRRRGGAGGAARARQAEHERELPPYGGTLEDFDELAIMFGFVSLFAIALPVAPLLALAAVAVEVRVDAAKLCGVLRRPMPESAAGIGTWHAVLAVMSFAGVLTACAIVAFETDLIATAPAGRLATFLVLEHAALVFKAAIAYLVPDRSRPVRDALQRQEHVVDVLVHGMDLGGDEGPGDETGAAGAACGKAQGSPWTARGAEPPPDKVRAFDWAREVRRGAGGRHDADVEVEVEVAGPETEVEGAVAAVSAAAKKSSKSKRRSGTKARQPPARLPPVRRPPEPETGEYAPYLTGDTGRFVFL